MNMISEPKKRIVIFDFDGTLTHDDTFFSFAKMTSGKGTVLKALVRSLPSILKWKLGKITNSEAKEKLFANLYKGLDKNTLLNSSKRFIPKYREETVKELQKHLTSGDDVWIVSASLDLWLFSVAERLGVKVLCTNTEVDKDGKLTGKFSTPNCYGEEKVRRFREIYPDLENRHIIAYGDNPGGGDAALRRLANRFIRVG